MSQAFDTKPGETFLRKSVYGWQATTYVPLLGRRALKILTMRRSNGQLLTTASVVLREESFETYTPFTDFNQAALSTTPARVTMGAVAIQQQRVLDEALPGLLQQVSDFYLAKEDGQEVVPRKEVAQA